MSPGERTVTGTQTTLTLSGLTPNTAYGFQAGARDSTVGSSTKSAVVTVTTYTLAAVPTVTDYRVYTTSVSITLGQNSNPVGTALMVSTGTDGFFGTQLSSVSTVSGASTVLVITGLSPNASYGLQAGARDASAGSSTQSLIVAVSTVTNPIVTSLSPQFASVMASSFTVNWNSVSGASYNTVLSSSSNFSLIASSALYSQAATSYVNLSASVTYYFRVKISTEGDISTRRRQSPPSHFPLWF